MPPNTATLRVGPYLLSLLVVLIALFALVFLPGQRHTPKLGLDLEGGATVTLEAQTPNHKTPSQSAMRVARQILENRVNAKGVSAAQVFQQGSNEIVISVPGANSHDVAKIGQAAKLNFRPLVMAGVPNTATTTTATPSTSGTASSGATAKSSGSGVPTSATTTTTPQTTVPKSSATTPKSTTSPNGLLAAPTTTPAKTAGKTVAKTTAAKTTAAKTTAAASTTAAATSLSGDPFTSLGFPLPTTDTAFNALTSAQQAALTAALGRFDCKVKPTDVPSADLAACDDSNPPGYKYLLGPVLVAGTQISSADAVAPDGTNTQTWTVSINLKSTGQTAWAKFTGAHHSSAQSAGASACSPSTLPCADFVAFTLDGAVIGAPPQTQSTINGTTQVSGNFTEGTAKDLANDLKYGALPLNFRQLQAQDISATLGSSQLTAGLLAGGIGLLLVVIYSFLYYRGLGFVTVFSLVVSGALTYACLVILGRAIGFTLTLAGIAGFIVAVGITADSFVVLFERLKDEVHSGRSIRVAVPRAWTRARRTILSADTVSFLAALILYYFTVGDVRGFAFTLGLSTLLDLVVVFLFTHPLVSLLSRSRAFGSPRFTGLNSVRTGGIAPSPEGHVRPVGSKPASGGKRRAPAGSVALLEREADTDLDDDVLADAPAPDSVASASAEPELNSGAPRRSRVVPRSAPAAEIGADAAERAAARRGRTVRPPRPKVEASVEDDLDADDLDDELAGDAADNLGGDGDGDDSPELSDTAVQAPPIAPPKVEPVKAAPVKVAPATTAPATSAPAKTAPARTAPPAATPAGARAAGSTAAERAAARRRRPQADAPAPVATAPAQPAPAVPEPAAHEPAAPEPAVPEPAHGIDARPASAEAIVDLGAENDSLVASAAEIAPEPAVEAETAGPVADTAQVPRETATGDARSRTTTAAERAAARRARIRTRAGSALDTDGEDES